MSTRVRTPVATEHAVSFTRAQQEQQEGQDARRGNLYSHVSRRCREIEIATLVKKLTVLPVRLGKIPFFTQVDFLLDYKL